MRTPKDREKYHKCLAAITEEYATELTSAKHDEHPQIGNNWLDNLIKKKKYEFQFRLIVTLQKILLD